MKFNAESESVIQFVPSSTVTTSLVLVSRTDFENSPGLHVSRKDPKYTLRKCFLSCTIMAWSLHSCNDHKYGSFTRINICNRLC